MNSTALGASPKMASLEKIPEENLETEKISIRVST